jgi:hypothetical protein
MKRTSSILFLATTIVLSLVYLGYSVRQSSPLIDRYDVAHAGDVQVKQLHLYLTLFNGTDWTPEQKELLLDGAKNPQSLLASQQEVATAFPDHGKQIFGGVGSYDIKGLRSVYYADTLADKKALMRDDRGTKWRQWMAVYAASHQLTDDQIEAFFQVSKWIDTAANHTRKEADEFANSTVVPAFGKELSKDIFGPIGSAKAAELCAKAHGPTDSSQPMLGNCDCSFGSSWNWSCSGTCKSISDGACNRLGDGCGFLGYYACDSVCGPSEEQ